MKKFQYLSKDRKWLDVPECELWDNGNKIYDTFSNVYQIREVDVLHLECMNCSAIYDQDGKYLEYYKEHENVHWKWKLIYCDECRHNQIHVALKSLPEILNALSIEN